MGGGLKFFSGGGGLDRTKGSSRDINVYGGMNRLFRYLARPGDIYRAMRNLMCMGQFMAESARGLCWQIGRDEFWLAIEERQEPLSQGERDLITAEGRGLFDYFKLSEAQRGARKKYLNYHVYFRSERFRSFGLVTAVLYKTADDWFLLAFVGPDGGETWKCDGVRGLVELLPRLAHGEKKD